MLPQIHQLTATHECSTLSVLRQLCLDQLNLAISCTKCIIEMFTVQSAMRHHLHQWALNNTTTLLTRSDQGNNQETTTRVYQSASKITGVSQYENVKSL